MDAAKDDMQENVCVYAGVDVDACDADIKRRARDARDMCV